MQFLRALRAFFVGISLCATDSEVRSLSFRPWFFGLISYLILAVVGVLSADRLVLIAVGYGLPNFVAWLVVIGGIAVSVALLSFLCVMIFAGIFQSDIARIVFQREGVHPPEATFAHETFRVIFSETVKLLWLLPLLILAFVLGMIPFTAPVGFLLGAWLLGYQSTDCALDALRIGGIRRLWFCIQNGVTVTLFGAVLALICLIPFAAIFLSPPAAAGAAWLFVPRVGDVRRD